MVIAGIEPYTSREHTVTPNGNTRRFMHVEHDPHRRCVITYRNVSIIAFDHDLTSYSTSFTYADGVAMAIYEDFPYTGAVSEKKIVTLSVITKFLNAWRIGVHTIVQNY